MESLTELFIVDFLILAGIPLAFTSFAAILLSIFQAATQLQEQTLGFLLKLGIFIGFSVVGGQYCMQLLSDFLFECYRTAVFVR